MGPKKMPILNTESPVTWQRQIFLACSALQLPLDSMAAGQCQAEAAAAGQASGAAASHPRGSSPSFTGERH